MSFPGCKEKSGESYVKSVKIKTGGRACVPRFLKLSKNSPAGKPRRVPSSPDDGIKSKSVISGDMRLGNDTSHGGWGDYFARNRIPPAMRPFVGKGPWPFSTICQQSLAPAGMASSTMMRWSFSSPFSLWTAEISMPWLSWPIIFRGGRFTMATKVLPTSSSGW